MGLVKSLYFSGISVLDINWLRKKSPVDVLIPFHHLVSDEPVPHISQLYSFKNTRQFEADLDWLLKHFKPVSLSELIKRQKLQQSFPGDEKSFLLTFDDALRQVHEVVAPILSRKGIPAALFVNPAFVDNKELFYDLKKGLILDSLNKQTVSRGVLEEAGRIFGQKTGNAKQLDQAVRKINYLNKELTDPLGDLLGLDFDYFRKEKKPFMTREEITGLTAKGFEIGAHSIDHPLYALVSHEEQIRQTLESVDWVEKTFAPAFRTFAFPHIDTGVPHSFFEQLTRPQGNNPKPALDLILGNSTGMLESHPRVVHRFIGENPAIPAGKMIKAVLTYSALRKQMGKPFVKREN